MTWFDVGALHDGATLPDDNDDYVPVRTATQKRDNVSFSEAVANGVGSFFNLVATGSGQTVNQTGGNLVIASGTTAKSETIIRSVESWKDAMTLRWASALSQRIVNQSFIVELVDLIGDGLAYTITSATAISVVIPNNPFTASSVGQSMTIGNYNGTGTWLSGPATIASVSGNTVTFTVSGFAVGSGTCSIWGWNFVQAIYSGTSATSSAASFNTQRRGYPRGATAVSTATSAAPGAIGMIDIEDGQFAYVDTARGAGTATPTLRTSWYGDVPDGDIPLFLQIRLLNGATAPATTTSWTLGFVAVENYVTTQVSVSSVRPQNPSGSLGVVVESGFLNPGPSAGTANSLTAYSLTSAASTNAAAIKTSAGNLFELTVSNPTATPIYVKFFNKASAPTVGDVPILTIPVAATSTVVYEFGAWGKRFATGIAIAATGGILATDTANAVAGAQISASYV